MHIARIAELLKPFLDSANDRPLPALSEAMGLPTSDLESISMYIDILLRWNARINLTAIRDPEEIVTRHFGESLFAARHLLPRSAQAVTAAHRGRAALQGRENGPAEEKALAPAANERPMIGERRCSVADVGSGAGFPGLPFKIWDPSISLTLIESNHKKATFLREVTRALTLTDVDIQNARAESLAGHSFDVVTLRAVERFSEVLPVAANLLAPAGRLALLIGAPQLEEACSSLPNLQWSTPLDIPTSRSRILLNAHRIDG